MIPEKPQHRSKLMANSDRITMLVINVISSGRSDSRKGATNSAASEASSTAGRMWKAFLPRGDTRPARAARAPATAPPVASPIRSALLRVDHVSLADDLVARFAAIVPADRDVHVHLAMHMGRHH